MPNSDQPKADQTIQDVASHSVDSSIAGSDETVLEQSIETPGSVPSGSPSASGSGGTEKRSLEAGGTFDRYRIEKLLGSGAMGAVYLATDPQLDRKVALKIPTLASSTNFIKRFHREARAAAGLRHANICQVYDVGEVDGQHYISMAYIEGDSLAKLIENGRQFKEREIAGIIRRIARALEVAHEQGIVHRDLKPANIMIDTRKEPIVMDFGLAKQTEERESRITREGTLVGSPAYMSPEQVNGDANLGPSTDIYSLGVILFEMVVGRTPFEGTLVSVIGQIAHSEIPEVQELKPGTSDALAAICHKATAKATTDRFQSMKEFAEELTAFMKGKSTLIDETRPAPKRKAEPDIEDFGATDDWEEDYTEDDYDERSSRESSSRRAPQGKRKRTKGKQKKSKLPAWIAVSAVGMLLVGGAVFAVQKLTDGDGNNTTSDASNQTAQNDPAPTQPGNPQDVMNGKQPFARANDRKKGKHHDGLQGNQQRRPLFDQFDNNRDGVLDHVEIPHQVIRKFDRNGDNALSVDEAAQIPAQRIEEITSSAREHRNRDRNQPFNPNQPRSPNDGNPDVAGPSGEPRPDVNGNPDGPEPEGNRPIDGRAFDRPPKDFDTLLARFDANKNGKVETSEAFGPIKTLDKNRDGEITREEFELRPKPVRPGGKLRPRGN